MILVSVVAFVVVTLLAGLTWSCGLKSSSVMWAWCSGVWFTQMVFRLAGAV